MTLPPLFRLPNHTSAAPRMRFNALRKAFVILFLGCVIAPTAGICQELYNGDLSLRGSDGIPLGWTRKAWSTSQSALENVIANQSGADVFLQAPSQYEGAAGWESKALPLEEQLRDGFVFEGEIRQSLDFHGSLPWVFVVWYQEHTYLGKTELKVPLASDDSWSHFRFEITPEMVPGDASHFAVVVACISGADSNPPAGFLEYKKLSIGRLSQ